MTTRALFLPLVLGSVVAAWLGADLLARGGESDEHLRWQRTYEDALFEARIRNVPVFVTRHKDE